jgi:phosphatidylglycerol:prolipoprotein diacylglycerol transferase
LFGLVYLIARQRRGLGFNSGAFLVLYATFRFITEFFRAPDPHMGFVALGWLTQGQVLCVPMVILGLFLMIRSQSQIDAETGAIAVVRKRTRKRKTK